MDSRDGERLLKTWVEMGILFCEGRRETDREGAGVIWVGGEGGGRKLGESAHFLGEKLGDNPEAQWEKGKISF